VSSGAIRPIVSSTYPLEAAGAAYARGRAGHQRGKIVVTVGT
jgi:NADPH:quinone reductase-like Zn-dependent oxidoreductase